MDQDGYDRLYSGSTGFYEQTRGLIAVWGSEAVQFLDGLISNDVKTLEDGGQMLAAFPNAQGRLLAVTRVVKDGERFLFETEPATRGKVLQNLTRFTLAGDFFVEDISENYRFFSIFGSRFVPSLQPAFEFESQECADYLVLASDVEDFLTELNNIDAIEITDEMYETLRIERGIPKYGVDMDETTIVPELGLAGLISYTKGCYIGQEIIARIHFRGHVAKQLAGLVFPEGAGIAGTDMELLSVDGKNAGRMTSVTYSPKLGKLIALAYVRYDYLAIGTELSLKGNTCIVTGLPFIK
jgi:aminomethyltransferase